MQKEKKIICIHLLNDFSGSPLVLSSVIRGLNESWSDVELFTGNSGEGFLTGLPVKQHKFFYRFFENKYLRLLVFTISQVHLFFLLLRYAFQPVVFYVNTLLPWGAALAGKLMRKPVIYHLHETSVNPPALKKFLRMVASSCATSAIYVSKFLMEAEPLKGVKSFVVHNALPDEFVEKANTFRLHPVPKNEFTVLMICSLKAYKGVFDFIALAARLPEIRFELVLNSPEHVIKKQFHGTSLPSNLKVFPVQKDVHPFYQRASVVLNLSHTDKWIETFGMTLLEAMCYGIPVIAPTKGGVTEIVKHYENGFLDDVRNRQTIMKHIVYLKEDSAFRATLSLKAEETAKKFSGAVMKKLINEVVFSLKRKP